MADTPTSYPTWRFYSDGRTAVVQSPQELADLPPGHAGSPVGPFPQPPEPGQEMPVGVAEHPPQEEPEPPPDPRHEEAKWLRSQGQSIGVISRTLRVSRTTVRRWLEAPEEEEHDDG